MALFHFKRQTANQPCCDDKDCCVTEKAEAEPCCNGDSDCCAPGETDTDSCCCCDDDCCAPGEEHKSSVKVLGGGCRNCHKLADNAQEALKSLGMEDTVELISDMAAIAAFGVMSTPALVVDGRVVSSGRVLTPAQATDAIRSVRNAKD
ncbi:MAG: thioredoxin family protein [Clostridiales bacterium]|nr:thioredoxin family protein [Clostridiales bacterium]